jgi:hypothetical protein
MLVFMGIQISGRGVTVAYMLWEHAVRVQIPAPRQKNSYEAVFVCRGEKANDFAFERDLNGGTMFC